MPYTSNHYNENIESLGRVIPVWTGRERKYGAMSIRGGGWRWAERLLWAKGGGVSPVIMQIKLMKAQVARVQMLHP